MNKEKNFGVWAGYFSPEYSGADYQMLRSTADHHSRQFMSGVKDGYIQIDDDLTPFSSNPDLDEWVNRNDVMLTALVQDLQSHILKVSEFALPAHDERQILFKDAAEGLRFYQMEKPKGYKSTFVIPMFAHDIGRLLEGRWYDPEKNPHHNWIPHSQLSFMLLKQILDKPDYRDMPRELKNHFLYAVLVHSGDNGQSYMSRAVQTCDRMQLIGSEGFYRALAYRVSLTDGDIKYPDDPSYQYNLPNMFDHTSVLSILEYCSRNMRENIGQAHLSWQKRIAVENITLLKAVCEDDEGLEAIMFAPEKNIDGAFGSQKKRIDEDILEKAQVLYMVSRKGRELRWSPYEVNSAAIEAIERPHGSAELSDNMKESIRRAVSEMSDTQRKSLYRMMVIANDFRTEQDSIDRKVCMDLANDSRGYVRAMAIKAQEYAKAEPTIAQKIEPKSYPAFVMGT